MTKKEINHNLTADGFKWWVMNFFCVYYSSYVWLLVQIKKHVDFKNQKCENLIDVSFIFLLFCLPKENKIKIHKLFQYLKG